MLCGCAHPLPVSSSCEDLKNEEELGGRQPHRPHNKVQQTDGRKRRPPRPPIAYNTFNDAAFSTLKRDRRLRAHVNKI